MRKSGWWIRVVVAALAVGTAVSVVGVARTPAASAGVGDLTFADCVGVGAGCVATPGSQASALSLAVSHNGKTLYAGFNNGTDGGISRFSVGAAGTLSYADCINGDGLGGQCSVTSTNDPGGLRSPLAIALSPNDRSLYVDDATATTDGFVDQLSLDQGGKLQWGGCYSDNGSGGLCLTAGRPYNPLLQPFGIAVSGDGSSVYVAGTMRNAQTALEGVANHFLANANGQLAFDGCVNNDGANNSCGPVPGTPFGGKAEGVAISPSGDIYVGGDAAIAHFVPTTGVGMPFNDCISNDGSGGKCTKAPDTDLFSNTAALAISTDGKQLYALSTSGGIDHLTLGADGQMTWADCISDDGTGGACSGLPIPGDIMSGLTDLAISPDGTSLYAISSKRASVTLFSIGASGTLTFEQCLTGTAVTGCTTDPHLVSPGAVAVSPDSKSVYVTAGTSILHFTRATSGNGSGGSGTGAGGATVGTGTGTAGAGSGGSGGAAAIHTVSATVGNLALSFSSQSAAACSTAASTLHPKLSVAANAKSKATKWTFAKGSLFVDRGVRQVHKLTVRQNGKNVTVTKVTFAANQTLAKPGAVPLKLKGLKSGSHTLMVQVLLQRHAQSGKKVVTLSTTKTLRTSFKVC